MKKIVLEYRKKGDEWHKLTCAVPSEEACVRLYGLDEEPGIELRFLDVEEIRKTDENSKKEENV